MRKIITTVMVLAFSVANAQISLSLDPNFGNNGLVEVSNIHPDGFLLNHFFINDKIVVSYHGQDDGDPQTDDSNTKFLRFNNNGTLDNSFGTNGSFSIFRNEAFSFYVGDTFVYTMEGKKYLSTGPLDTTFGNNGNLDSGTAYDYLEVLSDNKILARLNDRFCKYTPSGNFDLTFGNGGCIQISSSIPVSQYNISKGLIKDHYAYEADPEASSPATKRVRKFDYTTGNLDTSYGDNGYAVLSDIPVYGGASWYNKNDNSIINTITANYSYPQTNDFFLTRTKPDGSLDLNFGNAGKINIGNNIIFNGDTYFTTMVAGYGDKIFLLEEDASPLDNPDVNKMGIRCYSYSGNNILINNGTMFSIEIPISNLNELESKFMEIRGNYLYLFCNKKIFRYSINESTLSNSESLKTSFDLTFENPFKDELILKTNEKIKEVELFDKVGRIILKGKEPKLNTASLAKGAYFIKITTDSNKIISKKGIKK